MNYIGIDPGRTGGMSLLPETGLPEVHSMPDSEFKVWKLVSGLVLVHRPCRVLIEKVSGYVAWSKKDAEEKGEEPKNRQSGSRMFNFGWGYGGLRMAVIALTDLVDGVMLEDVHPKSWQSRLKHLLAPELDHKEALKQLAQAMFPKVRVVKKSADSLLLAAYCKEMHEPSGIFLGKNPTAVPRP